MCKLVDQCITRTTVTYWACLPIGAKVSNIHHFMRDARIVAKKQTSEGTILITEDEKPFHESARYGVIWAALRGPSGIIYRGDPECDQFLREYRDNFERLVSNAMAL